MALRPNSALSHETHALCSGRLGSVSSAQFVASHFAVNAKNPTMDLLHSSRLPPGRRGPGPALTKEKCTP